MIEVYGEAGTPEHDAALKLSQVITSAWPWAAASDEAIIAIVPSVQCYGQTTRDIDIVLLAWVPDELLPQSKTRLGSRVLSRIGYGERASKVAVQSLCLAIEVKDHPEDRVMFEGSKAYVYYQNHGIWHDASMQSERQKTSLRNFLAGSGIDIVPFVTNLIWFRNLRREALPDVASNLLPATFVWGGFLNVAVQCMAKLAKVDGEYLVRACNEENAEDVVRKSIDILLRKLEPTPLDRRRVEAIARKSLDESLAAVIGTKEVILVGKGGTGKTISLLQMAFKLARDGQRALVLTYNVALASDISRLITLAGLSDDIGYGLAKVQTVQSFFLQVLQSLGVVDANQGDDLLGKYHEHLARAIEFFGKGLLTTKDWEDAVQGSPEAYEWDLFLLDEAQDWYDDERDLLTTLYGRSNLVIADGNDQLVRKTKNCDWRKGLGKDSYVAIQLAKSLRLKRNLASFANQVAHALGMPYWQLEENDEIPGGRVIVVDGDYFSVDGLHDRVVDACKSQGNQPVDMLACVPPLSAEAGNHQLHVIEGYTEVGQPVWDGTDSRRRRAYPTTVEELRIIQYESCRGLEGWVVVAHGLDLFYSHKHAMGLAIPMEMQGGGPVDPEAQAQKYAAAWLMIPLTRAIDTLVIELAHGESGLRQLLLGLFHQGAQDYMEWLHAEQ
jgi:hypothetical protein